MTAVSLRAASCSCGQHLDQAAHDAAANGDYRSFVLEAALRGLFPEDQQRRRLIAAVGMPTPLAALGQFLPLDAAAEAMSAKGPLEKKSLNIGFIPISCATPIIMAKPMGFYEKQGLDVDIIKTDGWAVVRDKTLNGEDDAAHMLSPMPIAISLGIGSQPQAYSIPAIENINGQAITMSIKHKDRRNPKD